MAGQEDPRTHFLGHLVVLGATGPARPPAYLLTRHVFEAAHRLGGLAGYAHYAEAFGAKSGLALDLPFRDVDFIEVLQVGRARYDTWYEALNTGVRIAPTAGSDYPCGEALPGSERFYTQVKGPLTRSAWLEGIRQGHTFATNGPLLRFTVDARPMGDRIALAEAGNVTVEGSVVFDETRDEVTQLSLIRNGVPIRTFTPNEERNRIAFTLELAVSESAWLALRASGTKRHAVGRPGLHLALAAFAQQSRRLWLRQLDALSAALEEEFVGALRLGEAAGQVPQRLIRAQRPALERAIEAARNRYEAK
jgi:hypothetical protein